MFDIQSLPDLSDSQYRIYNAIKTQIDLSKLQVSYLVDGHEWLDAFRATPTIDQDTATNLPVAHSSSHLLASYDFGGFVFMVNVGCGVYLEPNSITINDFDQPIFSIKSTQEHYTHLEDDELDEGVALTLLDYIKRNISNFAPSQFDFDGIRKGLLIELANRLEVAPKQVMAELKKLLD